MDATNLDPLGAVVGIVGVVLGFFYIFRWGLLRYIVPFGPFQ